MKIKISKEDRFGLVAAKSGFITLEQLIDAFTTQVEEELDGNKRRLVGKILYEKGYMTMPQIIEVIVSMSGAS